MSILSKLKGQKTDEKGASQKGSNEPKEQQQQRPDIKRNWTAGDMRQINRTTSPQMSRTNSEISVRSSRYRMSRASSSLSQDWVPSKQRAASLRSMGRNASFQGLAQVLEDGQDEENDVPPMPVMPSRYSSGSASSSRPKSSRSPYSAASSIGKSPLSNSAGMCSDADNVLFGQSAYHISDTTPADSEDSSNASSKSDDILEMRSHPFSHPEQFVFRKSQDLGYAGKGKAPMDPVGQTLVTQNENVVPHEGSKSTFESPPERRYFTKATPTGGPLSEIERKTSNAAESIPAAIHETSTKQAKKSRFSLFKKGDNAVAAH